MANDSDFLIEASLDISATVQNIQAQLKQVESQLKPINLDVKVNSNNINQVEQQTSKVTKSTQDLSAQLAIVQNRAQGAYGSFLKYLQQNSQAAEKLPAQVAAIKEQYANLQSATDLGTAKQSFQQMTSQVTAFKGVVREAGLEGRTFGQEFENSLSKFSSWISVATVFMSAINEVKSGIQDVIDLNTKLTQTATAMNTTVDKLGAIATAAQTMSQTMGANVNDVLDIMHVYANVNETADSIIKKTQADVILSNISGMSGANTTDDLQAIQQQFNLTDDQLMHVDDAITTVAQNLRMNYQGAIQDIADGTKTAGAMAQQAGMTFEQFSSIVGATAEKTRLSGDEIANSMKMIMARVGQVKGADPNTTSADTSKATKALESVGLTNFDKQTGQLRNMYDVLSDVAAKWPELTKNQKAYLSDSLAGQRQYSTFESIMLSFSKAQDLATQATNANGNALKQQQTYMESTEAKAKQFSSTVTSMWQNAISSQAVGDIIQFGTFLAQNIIPVLTTIAGLIVTLNAKNIESSITKIGTSIAGVIGNIGSFISVAQEAGGGVKGLAAAFDTLNIAETSVTGVIGVLITAFSLISMGVNAYNQAQQEAEQKALDAATNYKNESDSLDSLLSQYEQLGDKTNLTSDDKNTLKSIQNQLISTYGEEAKILDLVNGKYDDQIAKIEQLSQAKANEYIRENQDQYNKAKATLSDNGSSLNNTVDINLLENNRLTQGISEIQDKNNFTGLKQSVIDNGITGTLEQRVKILGEILDNANKISNQTSEEKSLVASVQEEYNTLNTQLTNAKSIISEMNQAQLRSQFAPQMSQMTKDAQAFSNAMKSGDMTAASKATVDFQKLNQQVQNTKGLTPELKKSFSDWANGLNSVNTANTNATNSTKSNATAAQQAATSNTDLAKSLQDLMKSNVSNYQSLETILQNVKSYGTLSSDNLNTLLKTFPDMASSVLEYNAGLKSTSQIVSEIKQKMQSLSNSYKQELQQELANNANFYSSTIGTHKALLEELANGYNIDYRNYTTYQQLKNAIDSAIKDQTVGNTGVSNSKLEQLYFNDVQNYSQMESRKESVQAMIQSNLQNINGSNLTALAQIYGVDVSNYKSQQSLKSAIAAAEAKVVTGIWSQTEKDYLTRSVQVLSKMKSYLDAGNTQQYSIINGKRVSVGLDTSEAKQAADKYASEISGLNALISDNVSNIDSQIDKISSSASKGIPSTTSALKSAESAANKAGKAAESAENKAAEAAKKAAEERIEALKKEYEHELNNIEAYKEMGKYTPDKYGVEGLGYYNDLSKLYAKWKNNTALDYETILQLQEKVLNAQKDYQQNVLNTSYKEIEDRVKLGTIQENSKTQLQQLLDIQRNLNSSGMSLVNTKENQLELEEKIYDLEKAMREQDKSNIESLMSTTEEMLKKQYDDEKTLHQKRIDDIKEEQKARDDAIKAAEEALEKQKNEYSHNEEQGEKEKAVADLQAQIAIVSADTSDAGIKKKLDLQKQLADAQKALTDYQFNYSIDQQKQALEDTQTELDKQYQAKEDEIQKEVDAIDKAANDEVNIREQAMKLIDSKSQTFYNQLIEYNKKFGTGISQDIVNAWNAAYTSLANYGAKQLDVLSTLEQLTQKMKPYSDASNTVNTKATRNTSSISPDGTYTVKKGDTLSKIADWFGISLKELVSTNNNIKSVSVGQKVKIPHYENGTSSAQGGLSIVNENGQELILDHLNNGQYRMLAEKSKVLTADMANNIEAWSKYNPQSLIAKNMLLNNYRPSSAINNTTLNSNAPFSIEFNIAGNADSNTVSQLKSFGDSIVQKVMREINNSRSNFGSMIPVTSK